MGPSPPGAAAVAGIYLGVGLGSPRLHDGPSTCPAHRSERDVTGGQRLPLWMVESRSWLGLAAGEPKCVDALVRLVRLEDDIRVGLGWIERLTTVMPTGSRTALEAFTSG